MVPGDPRARHGSTSRPPPRSSSRRVGSARPQTKPTSATSTSWWRRSTCCAATSTRGLGRMLEVARVSRDARFESSGVTAYRVASAFAAHVMDYRQAEVGLREGLRYADEIEQSYCRHVMAAVSAHVAWAQGRWDEAVVAAEIELVEKGSRRGTLGSRDALGFVALGRGDVDRARALLEDSLAIGRPSGEVELVAARRCGGSPRPHWSPATEPELSPGARRRCRSRRQPVFARCWCHSTSRASGRTWPSIGRTRPSDGRRGSHTPSTAGADRRMPRARTPTACCGSRPARRCSPARTSRRRSTAGTPSPRIWEATSARLDLVAGLVRANRHADAVPVLAAARATARTAGQRAPAAPGGRARARS